MEQEVKKLERKLSAARLQEVITHAMGFYVLGHLKVPEFTGILQLCVLYFQLFPIYAAFYMGWPIIESLWKWVRSAPCVNAIIWGNTPTEEHEI